MGFYIGIYLLLILAGVITASGLFMPSYYKWVIFPNNCLKIFDNQVDFSKISFVAKERKFIYLSFYGFSLLVYLGFTFLLPYLFWLMLSLTEYYRWKFTFPLIIIYLLFQIFYVFVLWKLWKKISPKITTKKEAVNNFLEFKKNWTETNILEIVSFRIEILSQSQNRHNQAFQYHQKRLREEISNLNEKKLTSDVFNYKLLQLFISYLQKNAWQFQYLKNQFVKYKIWINDDVVELNELKTTIINNFFSIEAKKIKYY